MKIQKLILFKRNYYLLLFCCLQLACYKDLDNLSEKNVTLIATNKTGQNVENFKVYAFNSENLNRKILDSVSIKNLSKSSSKNIVFKNNNLGLIDGQFEIIAKFENGKNIKSDCCYFKNGSFLVSNLNFSINDTEISVKSY